MTDWPLPDVVLELRAQGLKVECITPQNQSWLVEDRYILTTKEMRLLKAHGKLSLEGIKERSNHAARGALPVESGSGRRKGP